MAEDTRNYIEQTQSRSMDYNGRELSAKEMATEFAKCDIDTRVAALQSIASESEGSEYSSAKEAAKHYAHRRALRDMHERLRKVGR